MKLGTWTFLVLGGALGLAACGGDSKDTGDGEEQVRVVFAIVSPEEGFTADAGASVLLEVRATEEGTQNEVALSDIAWSAPEWAGSTGNGTTVTDLPVGTYELTATATVDGRELSDAVGITINALPVDYRGMLNASVDVIEPWEFTLSCPGNLTFTVEGDGTFSNGQGGCTIEDYPDYSFTFVVEGSVTGAVVDGALVMDDGNGGREETPFHGSKADDGAITATFDKEFSNDDGTMRLYGDWRAMPIP